MDFLTNLIKKNLRKNGKIKIYQMNGMKIISIKNRITKIITLIIGIKIILIISDLEKILSNHKEENNK